MLAEMSSIVNRVERFQENQKGVHWKLRKVCGGKRNKKETNTF